MEEEKILKSIGKLEKSINKLNTDICLIKEKIEYLYINIIGNNAQKKSKDNKDNENKMSNELKERLSQIGKLNDISEYDKIILKNLESRISILEEETQNYNNLSNL